MTTATTITQADLEAFIGTTNWYKGICGLLFTDGVKFLAEHAEAFWLIDVVASYQRRLARTERLREFQLWQIKRTASNPQGVIVTCRGDSDEEPVVTQHIPYSDFPAELLPLEWYVEGGVMLLKSEH